MASYNKVLLMGNLTRDPELRYTSNNRAVVNIGIACNRRYTTATGEKREEVTFVDCEAWGRTAEVINQYFSKGRPIFVEGRLKLDQWTDQNGQNRSKLNVVIESFEFLGSRGDGSGGGASGGGYESDDYSQTSPGDAGSGSHQPIDEDDIPF